MKAAYVIMTYLEGFICIIGAIFIPIYITPGYYWWTAFLILLYFALGNSLGDRIDKWEDNE